MDNNMYPDKIEIREIGLTNTRFSIDKTGSYHLDGDSNIIIAGKGGIRLNSLMISTLNSNFTSTSIQAYVPATNEGIYALRTTPLQHNHFFTE